MGQKVTPTSLRLGKSANWKSRWFDKKKLAQKLKEDSQIREFIKKRLKNAGVASVEIERSPKAVNLIIRSSKPGLIIGRQGKGAEQLKEEIKKFLPSDINFNLNILEVEKPFLNAQIILEGIIADIEKRIPYKRVVKQALAKIERAKALGAKIRVSGRLDGVEIARSEVFSWGRIPLHTLRADIDYAAGEAHTLYGTVGVKVWIYKGEIFEEKEKKGEK